MEIAEPEADEIELVPVAVGIGDFGLDGPEEVACLSLRFQVAQKLHAVTEQPPGRENLRFWDSIDLILLEELLGDDLAEFHEAVEAIFAARGTHDWPPELVVPDCGASPTSARRPKSTPTCHPTSIKAPSGCERSSRGSRSPGRSPQLRASEVP